MGKSIVFCNCGGEIIQPDRLKFLEEYLGKVNAEIVKFSDLCGIAAMDKDKLPEVFTADNDYLIIGCFPRSMRLLLEQSQVNVSLFPAEFVNCTEASDLQIQQCVDDFIGSGAQHHSFREIKVSSDWPSWYPVIDYARCTTCGQCADFCLFGVYEKTKERVSVLHPQGCKNNCPACARICPNTAIVFPKYKHGGAIAGSDQIDEIAEQARQSTDINEILGSDIYSALELRKQKRKSIIRNEAMRKAAEERDNALRESGRI